VRVLSPSGPVTPENLAEGLATLERWGLQVELDEHVYTRAAPGYFAGDDAERLAAIERALDDDVAAIFFSRGGYGLTRIVAHIPFSRLAARPRWVVGFSDITAFHLAAVGAGTEVATVHGHVVKSFASQTTDIGRLRELLFEHAFAPIDIRHVAGPSGDIEGQMVGGNAAIVAAMLDTPEMPDLRGSILVLEDVGEVDYRLDRIFTTIARSRRARGVQAVVLGDFTDCTGVYVDASGFPEFLDRLASELAERLECPVFADFPAGHGARNVPFPVGHRARIEGGALSLVKT
jgi:muramoyltetrapeptide carboxypeptidase